MAVIGSLSVKLGLVTVEWDQATNKAKQQAKDLQTAFNNLGKELNVIQRMFGSFTGGFNIMGIGIATLAAKSIALADATQDMAQSFGISSAKILEYRAALQASGVQAEATDKIIAKLFATIGEIQGGQASMQTIGYLDKMGISLGEIQKLKPEQALDLFAQGLSRLDNSFASSKIKELFLGAKGAKTLSASDLVAELKKAQGQYDASAQSIDRLGNANDNLKKSMQNLQVAFANILGNFVGDNGLVVSVEKFQHIIEGVFSAYVIKGIVDFSIAIYELAIAIKALREVTISFIPGLGQFMKFLTFIESIHGGDIGGLSQMVKEMQKLMDESKKLDMTPTVPVSGSSGNNNAGGSDLGYFDQYRARLKLIQQEIMYQKQLNRIKLDAFTTDEWTTKQKELQVKLEQQIATVENERTQELKGVMQGTQQYNEIKKIYDARIELIKETIASEQQLNDKNKQIQTDFVEGWKNAYNQYLIDSKKTGDMAAEAFKTLQTGLEDMLTEFFKTGKLNFRSFADMIITEIARMQAKAAAASIMGLFGGGGGGLFGLLSGLFGGGGASSTAGVNSSLGNLYIPSLLHSAGGNDIKAGQASIIGETGPEMFVPKQAGTIVSNTNMKQMFGQDQAKVVYNGPYIQNLSAIDTQSATQFLAKNKQGVWAANQSAQRALPQSR